MSYPEIYLSIGADHPYDHDSDEKAPVAKDWAEAAVRGILANLCDRRSIKWALQDEEIDLETRREIVASLTEIVRVAYSSPVPGDAGDLAGLSERASDLDKLAELNKAATPGAWYVVDTPWGNGDWICAGSPDPHAGTAVCNFEFLEEDRDDGGPTPQDDAAFVAALVTAYRSGSMTRASFAEHYTRRTHELAKRVRELEAALTPAAPRPAGEDLAGQGEPVAQGTIADEPYDPLNAAVWQALTPFMVELMETGGVTFMGLRNAIVAAVRPLYEAPAPSRTAVTEEEIAEALFKHDVDVELLKNGAPEVAWHEWIEITDKDHGVVWRDRPEKYRARARAILSLFRDADRAAGEGAR